MTMSRMGSMFRSEEMALCQLFIQPEAAYSSVSMLGEAGIAQFRDLNVNVNPFMRKFVNEVRRCDELERKLRYIEEELKKDDVPIPELTEQPHAPNPREIIDLEAHLEKTESEILELSQNGVNLKSNFKELKEMKYVLEKAQTFMAEQEESDSSRALMGGEERGRLGFVAGVVPRERVPAFERMLWRVSRGNVFLRQAELEEALEDPTTGLNIHKTAFIAFYQGENLKSRVKKVCVGFHASLYVCPTSPAERETIATELRVRLEDLNVVLNQTSDHRQRVLNAVAKQVRTWWVMVRKMKAIYHTLNMFNMDVTKKCLIGECWVPVQDLPRLRRALDEGGKSVGSSIDSFVNILETKEDPPSFIRTNKFTYGFQVLIDAYAVSSYREVNPALYTIVTFPFLFAVMFGDLGHGLLVTLFSGWMCLFEEKLKSKKFGEIWDIFFGGRYIILMMGVFSMYTGFLYNDIFSLSMNVFGSAWSTHFTEQSLMLNSSLMLNPASTDYAQHPYPMGLDPVWQTADNKIIFLNSFKMKVSVIIAVVHMIFGISLSVVNHIHYKRYINIVLDFLPQILFLVLLFGYMAFMMVFKYFKYYATDDPANFKDSPTCAPSVLITFINMMLLGDNPVVVYQGQTCDAYMFPGQKEIQHVLLVIAILCIPIMLFAKPIYLVMKKRRNARGRPAATGHVNSNGAGSNGELTQSLERGSDTESQSHILQGKEDEEHTSHNLEDEPFSEIMVHQAIHTVEYVLSTVSHTASYLRLWALSLAHAQLSEVLWSMIFRKGIILGAGFGMAGGVVIYVVFSFWVFFTVSVLVLMEGLSAFLHTLRLHWVEFMSKFYSGSGYAFEPFCFKGILDRVETVE